VMPTFATAHRAVVALIAVGVVVEFFFAGAGAFGATSYDVHMTVGKILLGLAGLAVLCSTLARRFLRHTVFLLAVVLLQWILGKLGAEKEAWVGPVHAVNALAVMATAGTLARRAAGATGQHTHTPDTPDPRPVNIARL
jgi:uncharacterized membrane protein